MTEKEFRSPLAVAVLGIMPWIIVSLIWLYQAWTADSFEGWAQVAVLGVASLLFLAAISIPPPWIYGTRVVLALRCAVILALLVAVLPVWTEHPNLIALLPLVVGSAAIVVAIRIAFRSTAPGVLDLRHPVPAVLFANQAGRFGNHHKAAIEQRWAADLSACDRSGRRATPFWASDAGQYTIFDLPVHAPCDGVVADCADGCPDNIDLTESPRYSDGRGNFIAIQNDEVTVLLAHLRKGSVAVQPGDHVRAGQPLARVGNSGRTSEPHLHLHCEIDGRGVPFTIDGRKLFRGARLRQP